MADNCDWELRNHDGTVTMVSVEQVGTHLIVSDENGTPLVELSPLEDIDMVERTARTLYRCGFPTATVGLLDMAAWVLEEATRE